MLGFSGCTSDDALKQEFNLSKQIDKYNKARHSIDQMQLKLLLLGAGDSGKSTIFKQVVQLYGKGYSTSDLSAHKRLIFKNITRGILELIEGLKQLDISLENRELERRFSNFEEDTELIGELAADIKLFWRDPGIQKVWEKRSIINFPYENFEYFMNNIDRIAIGYRNYEPKFDDWVRCRVTSLGITSATFKLYNAYFQMYDVGGQRSARKKWLQCFDNVVTIIFVAGMSGYDQVLFENHDTNRIDEAVNVWGDIVNRDIFKDVGFVLFLNKHDLFMDKITDNLFKNQDKNLNVDYEGMEPSLVPENEKEEAKAQCAEHIKNKFYQVIQPRIGFGMFSCHYTTAINFHGLDEVFRKSQEQVLKKHLMRNGLTAI